MPRAKAPAWTREEIAILREVYPAEGLNGVADLLCDRSWQAIYVMAAKLRLSAPPSAAPRTKLQGARLEEAIRLRDVEGWSFARIGAHFGIAETSASNAVLIALCPRKGYTPAQRDAQGRLLPEGLDRLRWMLRKGLKPVDIQLRLGLRAGRIAEERRRYDADLKARGKAALPPPGGGERYSGAKIDLAKIREVDDLLMAGFGASKVAKRTGVSSTHVGRRRTKLIARMKRKGQCLTGCDSAGRRVKLKDQLGAVPLVSIETLRREILQGTPVQRAARIAVVGTKHAYDIRDALARELAAKGEALPPIVRLGRIRAKAADRAANWLPAGKKFKVRYRQLLAECGNDEAGAKRRLLAELQATAPQPLPSRRRSFEEQLEAVRNGAKLVEVRPMRRAEPSYTLGGVATGQL